MTKNNKKFRSARWFGKLDRDGFIHRSWMKNQGFPDHLFDGRPVIGICNSASELAPCNAHLWEVAEAVKTRGLGGGRFSLGVSYHVVGGNIDASYHHVIS